MTPQELRASILQLAIQGKLVEQRPEEGTGEELYKQIQAEKQELIKSGKIKKQKSLPEITEDEIPFDIPENWSWLRLRTIVFNRGQTIPQNTFSYIDIGSIDNKSQRLNAEENIIEADKAPSRARKLVEQGDILYSTVRPYLHNMCIIDREFICTPIASTGFAVMTCHGGIYNKYLFYYLLSPVFDSYANNTENSKGVAYPAINDDRLYRAVVAIPPFAEQKRIVSKIEELLPYIERYEQAWSKLEEFNKKFAVDMQKSVLQMAIQGKLVEQRPEEGTGEELFKQIQAEKQELIKSGKIKKQKALAEIIEDEIPFDIPDSWRWVQFGELYSLSNGTASRGSKDGFEYPVLRLADLSKNMIDTSNVRKIKLTDKEFASHRVQEDDLIFIRVNGSKVRVATAFRYTGKDTISYCDHLFCGHKYSTLVYANYIMFVFNCPSTRKQLLPEIKTTAGQNTISQGSMAKILLPLPPLAEQKRIVAKLEEILPLCELLR